MLVFLEVVTTTPAELADAVDVLIGGSPGSISVGRAKHDGGYRVFTSCTTIDAERMLTELARRERQGAVVAGVATTDSAKAAVQAFIDTVRPVDQS